MLLIVLVTQTSFYYITPVSSAQTGFAFPIPYLHLTTLSFPKYGLESLQFGLYLKAAISF